MTGDTLTLRDVRPEDMAAIAGIYAHYVDNTTFSFEEVPPSVAEMDRRRAAVAARGLPYLVATRDDGTVIGYAYAALYRERAAYRYTVEHSIYLAPDATGRGVGRALLSAVIDACERRGMRQMIAVIGDSDNRVSIGFHGRMGFTRAGVLHAVGYKFGRWIDSVLMLRPLGDGDGAPPRS